MQDRVDGFSKQSWYEVFDWIRQRPQEYVDTFTGTRQHYASKLSVDLLHYLRSLEPKVARKFLNPSQWIWSSRHLELSSNQLTAEMVASHFPVGAHVLDIGCGGGADAVALAGRGPVTAIDRDDFAVRMTLANRELKGEALSPSFEVQLADAESLELPPDAFVHLDPDRRQVDRRSISLQWHSPAKESIVKLVTDSAGGSMKLAPACNDSPSFLNRPVVKHWISFQQSVVQQRWWWGLQSLEDSRCFLSAYSAKLGWVHASPVFDQFAINSSKIIRTASEVSDGSYIGDGDPALRAAGCQAGYVEGKDCWMLGATNGYYLANAPIPELPLIKWRKVARILALRGKDLRNYINRNELDGIELKTRLAGPISSDIQKLASVSGNRRCYVYATKLGSKACAIIAQDI